jgi:hypothetical protein
LPAANSSPTGATKNPQALKSVNRPAKKTFLRDREGNDTAGSNFMQRAAFKNVARLPRPGCSLSPSQQTSHSGIATNLI